MLKVFLNLFGIAALISGTSHAEGTPFKFEDQSQYELYYEYMYQLNFVEFLTSDCTSNRKIGGEFYGRMSLSKEYNENVLGVDVFTDVFAGKKLIANLWGELVRGVKRNDEMTSALDPVGYAQFKAHQLIDDNKEIYELICEEVYWDEVLKLKTLSDELMYDAEQRISDRTKLNSFRAASKDEIENLEGFIKALKPAEY